MDYQDTKYAMEILDDALTHFLLLKQRDEPLHQHIKRFKTSKEVAKSRIGGPIVLTKVIKSIKYYDENDK